MTAFQTALLVGLLAVAAVHTRSRVAGAFAASTWVLGAFVFGALSFESRRSLVFVGIETPPWLYFAFMAGLFLFNATVIVRAFRRRITPTPSSSTTTTTTNATTNAGTTNAATNAVTGAASDAAASSTEPGRDR